MVNLQQKNDTRLKYLNFDEDRGGVHTSHSQPTDNHTLFALSFSIQKFFDCCKCDERASQKQIASIGLKKIDDKVDNLF